MAGQIIERSKGIYTIRVFIGRDAKGKRKYQNRTVHGSKKEAQLVLTAMLREKDLGVLVQPAKKGFGDHAENWMETVVKPRVRNRTFIDYRAILDRYILPTFGAVPISHITPEAVQKHYSDMQKKGLSAQTVRHTHAVLCNVMKQAVRWRLIPSNPCDHVDLPQVKKVEMKALDQKQAVAFLEKAKESNYYPLFALLLSTGLRPGEALALRWCDLDLKRGTLSITRALSGRSGDFRFEEPKTPKSRRMVPLPKTVTEAFKDFRKRKEEKAEVAINDEDLIFTNTKGKPIDLPSFNQRHFKPILEAAKLSKDVRLYDLRHSCATLLLQQGTHPKVVSERLGHASAMQTLDRYSHMVAGLQQTATSRLETMLFKKKPEKKRQGEKKG